MPKPVKGMDMLIALGGPKKASEGSDEPDYKDDSDDAGLPMDFEAAWKEYHDHPTAQAMWDMIECCKK